MTAKSFFAYLLMTVGVLSMLLCGGCGLLFLPAALNGDQYVNIPSILILSGIPTVFGLLLFLGGRALLRSAKRDADQE